MNLKCSSFGLALVWMAVGSSAALGQTKIPRFEDYPARNMYKGPNARLVLTRADMTFKTRLRVAARERKTNFAGHYIVTTWGCGSACVDGAVIDAKTGKVYWW